MTVISESLNQRTTADHFFRLITDGLTDYSIVLLDADGFIVSWPRSAQMIEGYSAEDVLGEHVTMFWPMEDRAYVNQILREANQLGRSEIESWVLRENGERYWADVVFSATRDETGETTGFIRVLRDQTERRRAEEAMIARTQELNERRQLEQKLRQAQKMEAVGRLAGGIAHDFNNLLTAIRGNAELLLNDFPLEGGVRSNVEEINHAADRAAALTRQLLAFSRRQFLQPSVLNLDSVLGEMGSVVRGITGDDIKLITRTAGNGACLRADRGQLEQVLMNLAVNARDAMPQGGTLTLESGTAELDDDFVRTHPGAQTGSFVRLSVTDTGRGMDAPILAHLFEPFFTTKAVGQGTGLGLATVYGIVKQSDGYIDVQSKAGAGTRFDIYLPRVWQAGEGRSAAAARRADAPEEYTVLLVEDEDAVRALASRILRKHGYQVLEARDGIDAQSVAANYNGPISILLTDVVMPRMGGRELVEALRDVRPNLRVLYMSGYTDDALVHHGVVTGRGTWFLQKPFTPEGLARKLREVIEAA
jgi:two-component system, cell cycle sensor histidine kinase and response regulator CckA